MSHRHIRFDESVPEHLPCEGAEKPHATAHRVTSRTGFKRRAPVSWTGLARRLSRIRA